MNVSGEPVEKWGPGRKTLTYVVKLEGATVQRSFRGVLGPVTQTFQVDRVEVTTRWVIGQEEEEGRTTVKLDCREIMGGQVTPVHEVLYPDSLDEVPPWLTSIETRASPRGVG